MKLLFLALMLCTCIFTSSGQSVQRIPVTAAADAKFPQWDYSSYLTDNLDSLVPEYFTEQQTYSTVILTLQAKAVVSKISLIDGAETFADNPAFIYAINGKDTTYIGKFSGELNMQFSDIVPAYPIIAAKIAIKKYGNNIPQKLQVFGLPWSSSFTDAGSARLLVDTITASINTGMNYTPWLNDNLSSLVASVWASVNNQYVDVRLKLNKRSLVYKIALYDEAGTCTTNSAYIYLQKDTSLTQIAVFQGLLYKDFVYLNIPEGLQADAIIVRKYGNNIPQKVWAYGRPLPTDPFATVLPGLAPGTDPRIPIISVNPAFVTGQNYQPWLVESLDSLVADNNAASNMQWVDVTLTLPARYRISKICLFDHISVFNGNPALVYTKNDTTLKLIGSFDGSQYLQFKNFDITDSTIANAIVIHKYGNNIPQKIQVYGKPLNTAPPVTTDSAALVKIPIDAKRWFILNYAPKGIGVLFNGNTTDAINTGYASFKQTYDCIYPLNDGEKITLKQIKMFDYNGDFSANPAKIFAIKKDGSRLLLATFTGSKYNQWVGPYPDRNTSGEAMFNLDNAVDSIQYIGITCTKNDLPAEIEFYGSYTAPVAAMPANRSYAPFGQTLGMNAFEWDFVRPGVNSRKIAEDKYAAIKNFRGFRHYLDWYQIETNEGKFSFNPTHSGGWDYDMTYERCKRDSIEVLACIKNLPPWMVNTYPSAERSVDNVPVRYGRGRDSVQSYLEKGRAAFQFAARYGANKNIPLSKIKVNTQPRWPYDPANVVKVGLELVKYIECGNELDKWWKGSNGYMNCYEYAALLSAFYDGHKGLLGDTIGVKNADSTMQVVMGGIAFSNPAYVRGMIEWCRQNRGYKANGKIDLCWDVINYHHYSNDVSQSQTGSSTRGAAPEVSDAQNIAKAFVELSEKYAYSMPVWVSELGFDINQGSTQKAITIGSKTALQTQADWTLRSSLVTLRQGINRLFFYELKDYNANNATKYASMGLTDTFFQRRPAMDYLYQVNQLLGNYHFNKTVQQFPIADEYINGDGLIYAVWMPTEKDSTAICSLPFPGTDSVTVFTPVSPGDNMQQQVVPVVNGVVQIVATETPVFVQARPVSNNSQYVKIWRKEPAPFYYNNISQKVTYVVAGKK